ncbi:tryptophan synthase subunit alpha [Trueperella bialowiezensis]|uniref:Tryptophan synthase alpha chain n=1 Tax=Trueperella bialowiezensis TaxID=312285 RepID=A0A448PBQ3_9ACTO|nr:tryptophan synthase subunit alpha [Trueperella bialowiezensis]VEI12388.1 Tryptophan synthase alpha chain [Trueperella bialowiezensis]
MTVYVADKIDAARNNNHAAFIAYLSGGFPSVQASIDAAKAVVDAGADIIEIGFPYSDPTMDGVIIQESGQKALDRGLKRADMFRIVEEIAATGAAVAIMTYYNPVFVYGVDNFARDLANAGGAGLITPDLIPEEAGEWIEASNKYDLDRIFLVAPTSTDERIKKTVDATRGFVYAASRMGVTGLRSSVESSAEQLVQRTRAAGAENVCVGIGVSNRQQAEEVAQYADGVIVGSALVQTLVNNDGNTSAGLRELHAVASDIAAGAHTKRA